MRGKTSLQNSRSTAPHPKFAIAIDLGSNTLRVVKRDCLWGRFVAEYEKIVRTAEKLEATERIGEAAIARIIEGLKEAEEAVGFDGATLRAVTTEALRRAANGEEVLAQIAEETGVDFEIIDGEEEAALTLRAVRGRLEAMGEAAEAWVLVDIGGGSTELTFLEGPERRSKSFPVGIVTMAQKYPGLEALRRGLAEEMGEIDRFVREWARDRRRPRQFVATAGTPTTVAALKLGMDYASYDASRINGTRLRREELEATLRKLLAMTPEERSLAVGVGRADLINAGILIFEALYEILGFQECVVIDDGLREGVALSLCMEGE